MILIALKVTRKAFYLVKLDLFGQEYTGVLGCKEED
jgi:hypothetical protein